MACVKLWLLRSQACNIGCFLALALLLGTPPVSTSDMEERTCSEELQCEDACCESYDLGVPYCCSRYQGYIYLGLMVGGGVIVALLVIACYVVMRRSERELEAAARLEEIKAVNRSFNNNSTRSSSNHNYSPDLSEGAPQSYSAEPDLNVPPPAYGEVMRTFVRCHSCDMNLCQHQQLQQQMCPSGHLSSSSPGLPDLVNISQFLAQHMRENFAPGSPEVRDSPAQAGHWSAQPPRHQALPPPVSQADQWNKLPTYEEYTSSTGSPASPAIGCENLVTTRENRPTAEFTTSPHTFVCQETATSSLRRPVEIGHNLHNGDDSAIHCGSCTTEREYQRPERAVELQPGTPSNDCSHDDKGDYFRKGNNVHQAVDEGEANINFQQVDCNHHPITEATHGACDTQDERRKSCEELAIIQEDDEENHEDLCKETSQTGLNSTPVGHAREHTPGRSFNDQDIKKPLCCHKNCSTGNSVVDAKDENERTVNLKLSSAEEGQAPCGMNRNLPDSEVCCRVTTITDKEACDNASEFHGEKAVVHSSGNTSAIQSHNCNMAVGDRSDVNRDSNSITSDKKCHSVARLKDNNTKATAAAAIISNDGSVAFNTNGKNEDLEETHKGVDVLDAAYNGNYDTAPPKSKAIVADGLGDGNKEPDTTKNCKEAEDKCGDVGMNDNCSNNNDELEGDNGHNDEVDIDDNYNENMNKNYEYQQ